MNLAPEIFPVSYHIFCRPLAHSVGMFHEKQNDEMQSSSPPISKSRYTQHEADRIDSKTPLISGVASPGDDLLFPSILLQMLNDAEERGFEDIVSWGKDPTAFNVHKKRQFEKEILPKYFKMTKYKSFTRQLHNYGFIWIRQGPDKGGYCHKDFSRDDHGRSRLIPRKHHKGPNRTVDTSTSSSQHEGPDNLSLPISFFSIDGSGSSQTGQSVFSTLGQPLSASASSLTSSVEQSLLGGVSNAMNGLSWNQKSDNSIPFFLPSNIHSQNATIESAGFLDNKKLLPSTMLHHGSTNQDETSNILEPRTIEEMLDDASFRKNS